MIIRYGGGNSGIKEYLEDGRKMDRHFTRDEMDKRVCVEGDLAVTEAVYNSIEDKGQDRYLHITLSFNEPNVTEESISEVYRQYKEQLMSAYRPDEFNIYAEIHWPKIKEAYNHVSGKMEVRHPHLHVVIPKKNLVTGGFLNPIGMHSQSEKYLDAIQEKLNRDNGLSSPRLSPRIGHNHYEAALSRYKEKEFQSRNGETKERIYQELIRRGINTREDFQRLLAEFGEVKIRNQGKENQYFALRVPGDEKFTNLKANIFSQAYIEDRALVLESVGDGQVAKRIETWQDIQSREIKFISNASAAVKARYKGLSLPDRRAFLRDRENSYEQRYRGHGDEPGRAAKAELSRFRAGNYEPGDSEFTRGHPAQTARHLYELRTSHVDHFGTKSRAANRLLLQGHEDDHVHDLQAERNAGLRHHLLARGPAGGGGRRIAPATGIPQSSAVGTLVAAGRDERQRRQDLKHFADIRRYLEPSHLLAFAQLRFGVDPINHPISKAKDGSARIRVGKFNYNVSDFLTKYIGLEWSEAAEVLQSLYDKQRNGIVDKPKSKVAYLEDWKSFRAERYPNHIKAYKSLDTEVKRSYSVGIKAINSEYFSRRKSITEDRSLTKDQKHYLRSVAVLEKLQKIEALQYQTKDERKRNQQIKYPYSSLFYDFATTKEDFNVKILDRLKQTYRPTEEVGEANIIGTSRPFAPQNMPTGVEAAKRARLVAELQRGEAAAPAEFKLKLADLRPQPMQDGAVAFLHRDHGKQVFVNRPDHVELSRQTQPEEVHVALIYAAERFGSPLEIKGTQEFKEQVIAVAAQRDMDISFTDEYMNKALEAKRIELGMEPLPRNLMQVPELALDRSLPQREAVDKALLESKVRELSEIEEAALQRPAAPSEAALHDRMLDEVSSRHEEIASGMAGKDRIEEIAREDLKDFTYFEGKPEQQRMAVEMGNVYRNETYKSYADAHGPKDLKLTIDASTLIHDRAVEEKEIRKSADFAAMQAEPDQKEMAARMDAENGIENKPDHAAANLDLSVPGKTTQERKDMELADASRRTLLTEMKERHDQMESGAMTTDEIKVLAKQDLDTLAELQGSPHEHKAALAINNMMSNEGYREFMAENGPKDLAERVGHAQAHHENEAVMTPKKSDHDMEY